MKEMSKKGNKKTTIIILSIILSIIAVVGIVTAFLLNYNTSSPAKPIILDDGENIYISTSLNDNYSSYRFKFVGNGGEIIIDSEDNMLSVDYLLTKNIKIGQKYKISTCYLAENSGNNSEYSDEIEWTCVVYLAMPKLTFNNSMNILSWQEVENADYYRIYYSDINEQGYIQTTDLNYNMRDLPGKEMSVSVVAFSNNANYKTSLKSHSLEFALVHQFSGFSEASFDEEKMTLTAKSTEKYQKLDIYLDEIAYQTNLFNVTQVGNEYHYSVDLTTVFEGQSLIGIAPSTIDDYNVYIGDVAYAGE